MQQALRVLKRAIDEKIDALKMEQRLAVEAIEQPLDPKTIPAPVKHAARMYTKLQRELQKHAAVLSNYNVQVTEYSGVIKFAWTYGHQRRLETQTRQPFQARIATVQALRTATETKLLSASKAEAAEAVEAAIAALVRV
jgi:hypothetical protein